MVIIQNRFLSLEKFGDPLEEGNVVLKTQQVPTCGPDEVVVRMQFSCINPSDMFVIQGSYPGAKSNIDRVLPAKLGFEGSGIVHSVGTNVKSLKKGDKVFPFFGAECGAYSDFNIFPV